MRENVRVRSHEGRPNDCIGDRDCRPAPFPCVQRGIEGGDRRFDRPPFPLAFCWSAKRAELADCWLVSVAAISSTLRSAVTCGGTGSSSYATLSFFARFRAATPSGLHKRNRQSSPFAS